MYIHYNSILIGRHNNTGTVYISLANLTTEFSDIVIHRIGEIAQNQSVYWASNGLGEELPTDAPDRKEIPPLLPIKKDDKYYSLFIHNLSNVCTFHHGIIIINCVYNFLFS